MLVCSSAKFAYDELVFLLFFKTKACVKIEEQAIKIVMIRHPCILYLLCLIIQRVFFVLNVIQR